MTDPRVIVALDFADAVQALALTERLDPAHCRLKVGKELFTRSGPALVETLQEKGFEVFLDLKFHDIPNTVAKACKAAADLGVWMVNVHAMGGRKMMEAAREAVASASHRPRLIAVTVLTSMGDADLAEIGLQGSPEDNVRRLAGLAKSAGLDGVVCSPQEVDMLRNTIGGDFQLVTPGVRPVGAALNDQTRVATPEDAIRAGSSYLVIGRPITQADDPLAALKIINEGILPLLSH
ncbi:MAG: orotidine-5'-phosphate decarboxylase [Gammaproteobacteria bacterium]|nr:orotidine-5'-phosphate decarboxylase [Gammaproteobacteria bacterium]MCF6364176.1 orotidine-5'-phosphate decarboxylase [Gammaproteobacteria bacterium]